jgi:single-strand DNA-binding protein
MSLNLVNLVGRAGKDPEVRYFDSGKVLCTLTLAVNRRSSRTDEPDWFNLKLWDKTAEIAANYVKKGGLIGVQGSLEIETWTDRNTGANRSSPVIRVSDLRLLGSKRDNDSNFGGSYQGGNDEF